MYVLCSTAKLENYVKRKKKCRLVIGELDKVFDLTKSNFVCQLKLYYKVGFIAKTCEISIINFFYFI